MISDKLLSTIRASIATLTTVAAAFSGVMDLGAARNINVLGTGGVVAWVLTVFTTVAPSTGTVTLTLITSDNADMSSPTTIATHVIQASSMVRGELQQILQPPNSDLYKRYLRWNIVASADRTAGVISLEFVANPRQWRAYPHAESIVLSA